MPAKASDVTTTCPQDADDPVGALAVPESPVVVAAVVEVPRATVVVDAPDDRKGNVVVTPTAVVVLVVLVAAGLTSPEMRIGSPCRAEDGSIATDAAETSSARTPTHTATTAPMNTAVRVQRATDVTTRPSATQ